MQDKENHDKARNFADLVNQAKRDYRRQDKVETNHT